MILLADTKDKGEGYYVELKQPKEFRRSVLESLKILIRSLQNYENFKAVRDQKITEMNNLKTLVREISALDTQLKNSLPKLKMSKEELARIKRAAHHAAPKIEKKEEEEKPEPVQTKLEEPKSEADDLAGQLADIESQLNNL